MKVHHAAHVVFLCLVAFFFQTGKFMTSAATVQSGECLHVHDSTADREFQITDAISVGTIQLGCCRGISLRRPM
jgi:hypothetical protein